MELILTIAFSTLIIGCMFFYFTRSIRRLEHKESELNQTFSARKEHFEKCSEELAKTSTDLFKAAEHVKLLELRLKKSNDQCRDILETMEDEYFETDLAGNHTYVNQAICRSSGYTFEEYVRLSYKNLASSPESAGRIYKTFNRIYKTGIPATIVDHEVRRKDGSLKALEMSASLILDEFGEPAGFRGIARDVTEKKRIEAALRQSEERYRNILESMYDGYYEIDLAGRFTFVNSAMTRIFGFDKNELMGKHYKSYMDEYQAHKVFKVFNGVFNTGAPDKGIGHEIIRKDGEKRYVEAAVTLLTDERKERIGFRGVLRDITERPPATAS
ncbi:MAG: PAS domain S-box protein [Proteobacteria bacterium]|nr:PAS domain S-box protein [Pseudomonadota bacterium]MBU4471141.1 PAS domain S-box protein [Pseudomonadota bacterium]MCG2750264.1 PAS domain S-box protein [Desulfobacteraceae bacterium]